MTLASFLEAAWNQHAEHPLEVADRLATSMHLVDTATQIAPYAHLVAHVCGEHLGQWQRGLDLLDALGRLPAYDGGAEAAGALARWAAVLRCAMGERAALAGLSLEDRVWVLAGVAAACAGRGQYHAAIEAYSEALRTAQPGLPAGSRALRALAVGGNNLAAALEEKTDRDDAETAGMVLAAECGLTYWRQAGTWLEEERAEYRLARSLLQAGRARDAIEAARRCVDGCLRNDAPAFERFFGHVALALAQRAVGDANGFQAARRTAEELHEQVPSDDRKWCAEALAELAAR